MAYSLDLALLGVALLILLSVTASKISDKFAVPALLFFILIGVVAGWGVSFQEYGFFKHFSVLALVFIIFAGGIDTNIKEIRSVVWPGILLSTAGIVLTAAVVGVFAVYVLKFSVLEGLLLGAIVSSTDAAAVFSILRTRRVSLKGSLRPLLEFESSSNDPMAIFLTIVLIRLIQKDITLPETLPIFFLGMFVGAAVGWLMARGGLLLINRLKIESAGLYPALTLAMVVLVYSSSELLRGNGILAVYIMGVVMGNADFMHKKAVRQFYEGLAWLLQIAMFLMLGFLLVPSEIPGILGPGLVIAAVLMCVARPLSVMLSLSPFPMGLSRKLMISWVGLRGAAPIILATFPLLAGLPQARVIFNIVFIVVLVSILVQGSSISFVSRLLGVEVPLGNRRKYPIQFEKTQDIDADLTELIVPYDSHVVGRAILDIGIPAESLVVLISRDEKFIIPNGATVIEGGDVLLVLADDKSLAQIQKNLLKLRTES